MKGDWLALRSYCPERYHQKAWGVPFDHLKASRPLGSTGNVEGPQRPGRLRTTTREQDRNLDLSCLRDRPAPSRALGDRPQAASNVNVSTQFIRNRHHEAGMRSRCPAVRPPRTPAHRDRRWTWAALHRKWTRE